VKTVYIVSYVIQAFTTMGRNYESKTGV